MPPVNDFNIANVPASVSNPTGASAGAEYPRHMHAGDGRDPRVVTTDAEKDAAIKAGYRLLPWTAPPAEPAKPAKPETPAKA